MNGGFVGYPMLTSGVATGLTPISRQTLFGPASSLVLPVPPSYTSLKLWCLTTITSGLSGSVSLQINGDTGTNYDYDGTFAFNASTGANGHSTGQTSIQIGTNAVDSGEFSYFEIDLPFYAATVNHKVVVSRGIRTNAGANGIVQTTNFGKWNNLSPITSITLLPSTSTFAVGSQFALYGLP